MHHAPTCDSDLMHTAESTTRMQFQWCGGSAFTRVDGRAVPLPRKAMALLAYLCLEAGPHTRAQLSALLWPESDEVHAAMSLRQALSKLREVLGDALVADRQQVSLQRHEMPLADICDVHRFEALLAHDPVAACRTDVHRFLDALAVDDAPEFVHWCDRTRARLSRNAIQGLRRAAEECRAQRDWARLRDVSARWLAIDPLSVDAACDAIESAFLTRDVAGALAVRDMVLQGLTREELDDEGSVNRVRAVVRKYEKLAHPTPSQGMRAVSPGGDAQRGAAHSATHVRTAWNDFALRERQDAWRTIVAAADWVKTHRQARWITLCGGVGSGRSRLLHDATLLLVERGVSVMVGARSSGTALSAVASLVRSVMHADALAGVHERALRTLCVLVPELTTVYPALRRASQAADAADAPFAVQLEDALVQVCMALAEDGPVAIVLDDAMTYDRDSAMALQALVQRVAELPVLWLATDADDDVQAREQGAWAAVIQGGERVVLPAISIPSVTHMLADASAVADGWEPLAYRVHAAAHGMPGAVIDVLMQLEQRWGGVSREWQQRPLTEVPSPALSARLREHIDALDSVARTILLSLALVMDEGHPVPVAEWHTRPVLSLDDLSHIHGISRLRAAVLGEHLVECRLATEGEGGFRCASPAVVAFATGAGSGLVRDELRRLVQARLTGTNRM